MSEVIENLNIEMKRGTLTLLVLHFLEEKTYGYSLLQDLSENDVSIEAGTLYPLLRRLEKYELLHSDWDTSEARPRKYYFLSEKGRAVYDELKYEWKNMSNKINKILQGEKV